MIGKMCGIVRVAPIFLRRHGLNSVKNILIGSRIEISYRQSGCRMPGEYIEEPVTLKLAGYFIGDIKYLPLLSGLNRQRMYHS